VAAMRRLAHRPLAGGAHFPEKAGRALERKLSSLSYLLRAVLLRGSH
jgi:hypothetical protein